MTVIFKKKKAFSLLETIISLALLTVLIITVTIFTARIFVIRRQYNSFIQFEDNINTAENIIKSDIAVANNVTIVSCTNITVPISPTTNTIRTINYLEFTYLDSRIALVPYIASDITPKAERYRIAKFVTPIANSTNHCSMITKDPTTITAPSALIYQFPSNIFVTNASIFNIVEVPLVNSSVKQLYLKVLLTFNTQITGVSENKLINYLLKNQNAN